MVKRVAVFLGMLIVLAAAPAAAQEGKVVVVKMVDVSATEFVFEPAAVTVNPGDIVRWEQTSATPHNVDFRAGPSGFDASTLGVSDYLTTPGQTLEMKIDDRFGTGVHEYVCTPHEFMGMTGTITVEPAQE